MSFGKTYVVVAVHIVVVAAAAAAAAAADDDDDYSIMTALPGMLLLNAAKPDTAYLVTFSETKIFRNK